jgi:hypothetical protein
VGCRGSEGEAYRTGKELVGFSNGFVWMAHSGKHFGKR